MHLQRRHNRVLTQTQNGIRALARCRYTLLGESLLSFERSTQLLPTRHYICDSAGPAFSGRSFRMVDGVEANTLAFTETTETTGCRDRDDALAALHQHNNDVYIID